MKGIGKREGRGLLRVRVLPTRELCNLPPQELKAVARSTVAHLERERERVRQMAEAVLCRVQFKERHSIDPWSDSYCMLY